jgi:hypothetical protein
MGVTFFVILTVRNGSLMDNAEQVSDNIGVSISGQVTQKSGFSSFNFHLTLSLPKATTVDLSIYVLICQRRL